MNLNKVFILGRLTVDPQLRTTPAGHSVATLSVATNRVWTDKGGNRKEETEFHNVVVWGRQAEIASQFLTKGSMLLVEGRLQTRAWEDQQGQKRKTTEIISERLQLGPRSASAGGGGGSAVAAKRGNEKAAESAPDEIPAINLDEEIKPEDLPF
ncbi:MAG: single-stranded DNA-binding protein [Parcubacteria group bacterium]|nr:single-stranded DNA-binding protein [Parcubacteria group bacterium]